MLNNINNAETYLDGIAAASPIVNSVVLAIQQRLDEIQNDIPLILLTFDREIERDYATTKNNYERLQNLQEKLILSTTRLYLARIGDQAELDTLLQEDPSIIHFIPSVTKASPENMAAATTYLFDQLKQIDTIIHQMDETKTKYVAKQDELITWRTQIDEKIRIARTAITVWAAAPLRPSSPKPC